jgi:lipopolysaccharide/colanic/teichoic acid biosynthesis glycosyltransferase
MYKNWGKRLFDFILSLMLIIILSPLIVIIALILVFINKGDPFFKHDRPGERERKFTLYKFKTMTDERDEEGQLLPDTKRITAIGKFLRQTSLDELPQLFNVLKGDMSLVGPRPLLFRYIPLYNETQGRRHEIKPGITGWAQVNGRNSLSWQKKFELDVYYVDNISFLFDLKILWLTFLKVVQREGINQSSDRPMRPFTGNSPSE